jgi:hypothetical protein
LVQSFLPSITLGRFYFSGIIFLTWIGWYLLINLLLMGSGFRMCTAILNLVLNFA